MLDFLDHLPGMHCSNIKKNQHHQAKILNVSIFSQLVANRTYFWSETTVIFINKTDKDVHFGNVKIK